MSGRLAIELIPLQPSPPPDFLAEVAARLAALLRIATRVGEPITLSEAADVVESGSRTPDVVESIRETQLSSDLALDHLIQTFPVEAEAERKWVIGITTRDLAAPKRRFVFGAATLGGSWAIISSARLEGSHDHPRTIDRLTKEAIHEAGHLAELHHCTRPDCVMHPSIAAAEVDRKPASFCGACAERFSAARRP